MPLLFIFLSYLVPMKDQDSITPIDQYVIDFARELRNKEHLTQEAFGDILRVSRTHIKNIESPNSRAKYNIRLINALAEHFNISPKEFFPEKAMPLNFPGREVDEEKKQRKSAGKKGKVKKAVKGVKK